MQRTRVVPAIVVSISLVVMSMSATAAHAATRPPTASESAAGDCWSEAYNDPPNTGYIDIRRFVASVDCAHTKVHFTLDATRVIDHNMSFIHRLYVQLDTNLNGTDGCRGADFRLYVEDYLGVFNNQVIKTPSCDDRTWSAQPLSVGFQPVGSGREELVTVALADIGNPHHFRWWGSLSSNLEPGQSDRFPDSGGRLAACFATPPRATITGYWLAQRNGAMNGFGDVADCSGDIPGTLAKPVVGVSATHAHRGTWLVASDGAIITYGDAAFYGSTGAIHLSRPIVGMAATPSGHGYWLVASDGGIFSFGDATFYGSTGAIHLNKPIVGMAPTPSGHGYWLVASDGGIFSFGDAAFYGSTGAIHLNRPIVGMAPTPTGHGYWLVASDGGIFSYGNAAFHGSTGAIKLVNPIVGMASTPTGAGYHLVAGDGGVFTFGDATYSGSLAGRVAPGTVAGIAS